MAALTALRYRLLASHSRFYGRCLSNDVRDRELLAESIKALGGNPFVAGGPKTVLVDERELLRLAGLPDAALMASEAPAVLRELANALHKGVVLPADAARAVALWRRAEAAGDLDAGHNLALDEYSVNPEGGVAHLEVLAAQGHAFSQYSLAQALLDAAKRDAAPVAAAEGSSARAAAEAVPSAPWSPVRPLGVVDARASRALQLYQKAAKGGVLPAIHNVANMLANGDGQDDGQPNDPKARQWYEAAADLGDPLAMFTLSTWWAQGRGGPEDDAVALKWCEDAAFAGLPRAQFNAGCALLAGKGTPNGRPNHAAAAEWFRLAAERGMPEACVNLGEMCRLGLGTAGPPDYAAAKRWHARARDLGSGFAAELLEDDRNFMDDDAAAAAAK